MRNVTPLLFFMLLFMVGSLTAQINEDQRLKQEEFQRMQQQQLQENPPMIYIDPAYLQRIPEGADALVDRQTDQRIGVNPIPMIEADLSNANTEAGRMSVCQGAVANYTNSVVDGGTATSQSFPDFPAFSNQAADDFVIPGAGLATICSVSITGAFSPGGTFTGSPDNRIIMEIYDSNAGFPNTLLHSESFDPAVVDPDDDGSFTLSPSTPGLPRNTTLWMSVYADMGFGSSGQWFWGLASDGNGTVWVWRNPGGGFGTGCSDWAGGNGCLGFPGTGTDLLMDIAFNEGEPPTIACPSDVVADSDAGECGAVVTFADAVVIDPEDGALTATQTMGPPSGSSFPVGVTLIEYSATDSDGNTAVCSFTITVNDVEDPTATCQDLTVTLDEMGMATINAADLLASSDDNCGIASVVAGSPAGMSSSLSTIFAANNGGDPGGTVYFDLTVGPQDLVITGFETNTPGAGAVSMDVYTIEGGTYAGNETNAGAWSGPIGTATGTGAGQDNPTSLTLGASINLMANTTYAMALVLDGANSHSYTNGDGSNQNYSNADLTLDLGSASNSPFNATFFNPRVWNGSIVYSTGGGGIPVGSTIDLDCSLAGDNLVEVTVTDNSGNTVTCTATITVVDDTPPMIACIGQPVEMTANAGSSPAVDIPDDDPAGVSDVITVADDVTITDFNVSVDVSHTWVGDLQITLESPAGTVVTLMDRPGVPDTTFGCSEDNIDAVFDDEGADPVETTCPLTASLIPEEALSAFDGESTAGDWTLTIIDNAGGDTGTLNEWGVTLTYDQPGTPLEVALDADGMASFPASDLLVMVDDACGWTANIGGGMGDPCDQANPSNGFENGGLTNPSNGTIVANDLMVAMGTDFQLTQATLNLFHEVGATITNVDLVYYEDNAGVPGAQIGSESGIAPTSQAVIGNNFGFDVSETVLDVTPFTFAGDMGADSMYWISASVTSSTGGLTAWEITSASVVGGDALASADGGASWAPIVAGLDGVYVFAGNCIESPSDTVMLDCSNLGENLIDVTVTDSNGNTATCTATVNVIDVTAPVITCGPPPGGEVTANGSFESGDLSGWTAVDNPDPFFPWGAYNSIDGGGFFAPALPTDGSWLAGNGFDGASGEAVIYQDVTIDSGIDSAMLMWDENLDYDLDSFCGGCSDRIYEVQIRDLSDNVLEVLKTVTAMANTIDDDNVWISEAADLTAYAGQTVRIAFWQQIPDDFTGPAKFALDNVSLMTTVSGTEVIIALDENGEAEIDAFDIISSVDEACGISTSAVDIDEFTCDDIGVPIIVTAFVSDGSGNIAACEATVIVVDNLGPVLTCPEDQTVDPGVGNLFYEVPDYFGTGEATATDNCTDPVTDTTQDPAPGTELADGVYTVTLTATDDEGNTSTCEFELTVDSILGVNNNPFSVGITMYPNPALNNVMIANATEFEIDSVMIFDINGRLVSSIDMNQMGRGERAIDIAALASGVYMVQIEGDDQTAMKRLIKE